MGEERRQFSRLPAELRVEFRHLGKPRETYRELTQNLSEGGVFVETSVGLSVGTALALEISPGPGAPPIRLHAEVVRVEEEPGETGSRTTQRCRGMGLRFVDPTAAELSRLVDIAKRLQGADDGKPAAKRR
jgi:uncharacterized protein (TIGR02266 family)